MVACAAQLFAGSAFAADKAVDAAQAELSPISLAEHFAVLEDPSLGLTLADVQTPEVAARFKTGTQPKDALSFGYTRSAHWLRLHLRNDSDRPQERMPELGQARISSVEFHQLDANGAPRSIVTGSRVPMATRPYANRFFVFPLSLPAHSEQVLYLRLQSAPAIFLPVYLWQSHAFHTHERNDYLAQAWYFGMVAAMVLFNLLLFLGLRDVLYLLYVGFVSCLALALAAQGGLAKEFLWPEAGLWSDIASSTGYALSMAAFLPFMRKVLSTASMAPRLDRVLKILTGVFLLLPLGFVLDDAALYKPSTHFHFVATMLVLGIGLYYAWKRQRSAYFFVAAFVLVMLGGLLANLRALGILPTNLLTINGLQLGSSLEILLLAFALADRYNMMRREKARAQEAALAAEHRLVESLQISERVLEARVAERTEALQAANRQLEALSATDGLTCIANRRRFDEVLASEWKRAARTGKPLALAMLDVDWFKKYNDHYGHQAGDECLRQVAGVLAANICRASDLVARYGGEEFVFIAPATDGEGALGMAWEVCRALQALGLTHALSDFACVTASIGVASRLPAEGETADMLVKAADEALYLAKEQGRNRALLAG